SLASHINLAAHRFFSGSSIEANGPFELARGDQLFDCERGAETCGSEQVVSAAVSRRAGLQSLFHGLGLLGYAWKRIIFAEDPYDRSALAIAGGEGSWHTCD